MKEQPTLETDRLLLRPFNRDDASQVQRLAGNSEVAEGTHHIPHPYPEGAAERWIGSHRENYDRGEAVHFAILLKETTHLIGANSLIILRHDNRAELDFWIGREYWNLGYCSEAVREVIHFAFQTLGMHRIHTSHYGRNIAAGRVLQKVGMKYEGRMREHVMRNDVLENIELYGLLRTDGFIPDHL